MIAFWIAAGLLSAFAATLVLYRAARLAGMPVGDPTLDAYRRQLEEIEDLADRGLLADSERRTARAEAGRRLLGAAAAARAAPAQAGPSRSARGWVLAAAAGAPLLGLGLYLVLGSPGLPDQPFARRLEAWRNVPDPRALAPGELAAVLQDAIKHRPDDPEGRVLLARVQAAEGALPAAAQTLRDAARLAPNQGGIWNLLGEVLVEQAQGQETPQALAAFRKAAALDPAATAARYNLARARIMGGDLKGGLDDWRALAASLTSADDRQALQAQIEASRKAGRLVEPQVAQAQPQAQPQAEPQAEPPAALAAPGPSPDQVQSAAQAQAGAAPADQRAFIQSMVDGLAAKLKADPQDWKNWALLIHSYGVLGEGDRQAAAYDLAAKRFKADPEAMKALQDARRAGA